MKVAFDTTPLVQTAAGTARHVRGLVRALADHGDVDVVPFAFRRTGRVASLVRDGVWYPVLSGRDDVDLVHYPTFRGRARSRRPVVVTIHDLAPIRHPEAFPRWHRWSGRAALRLARRADAVVAVSEFTRDETVRLLGVPADRIHVVPNGVEPVFTDVGPGAEGDYVLAVGTLEPRKNLERTVAAAALAGAELRVAGLPGWGGVAVEGWVGSPSDDELAALYRGARCLVYPSLYEGFGIPILEAMACGTPVVTSRGGATEEVAGGAAVLVDPGDPTSIAAGIDEALRRRNELVALGRLRAAAFTWARSAEALAAVWRGLA